MLVELICFSFNFSLNDAPEEFQFGASEKIIWRDRRDE
jgi:hypothetical protein